MAQVLSTDGTWSEDFNYGYPYGQVLGTLPPEFDYEGTALGNAGVLTAAPGLFSLEYGTGSDNPDAGQPYGGAPTTNPYYLLFPQVSWGQTVGIFLTVTTTDIAVLSFDRAFSGYVGDRLSVIVNGIERISISGSAGYPWTRSTITIGEGVNEIAFVLSTANFASATTVREGVSQGSANPVDLIRSLRLSNLSLSNVAALPAANNQIMQMVSTATMTTNLTVGVRTPMKFTASAGLFYPAALLGRIELTASTSLSVDNVFPGRQFPFQFVAGSTLTATLTIAAHTASDTGGFAVGGQVSLEVINTAPIDIATMIRPLMRSTLTMDKPVFVNGRPVTPLAVCESEVETYAEASAVLDKVDPLDSTANTLPVTPTHRWLSIDALSDPGTGQLTTWHGMNYKTDPVWTTPGAYRPEVGNFVMKKPTGEVSGVHYPSVQFDAGRGDHLLATLKSGASAMTWVFVGSFYRFRGLLADSCPIIDFASYATINYTKDAPVSRWSTTSWADNEPRSSIYLGLTSYGSKEPTTSQVAFRTSDTTASYNRSTKVVLTDSTPVVLTYCLNGANSFIAVTPIVVGQKNNQAPMLAYFRRSAIDSSATKIALGKSRMQPPFGGSFMTGTMSLLELSYFNRALTVDEATDVNSFLVGLYTPTSADHVISDLTAGHGNVDTEQCLIYAADPEQPLVLISGSQTVVTNQFISTSTGASFSSAMNAAGVPTVLCSNADYAAIVATLNGD